MNKQNGLTEEEQIIMNHLADAWNGFMKLEKQHPCENIDFMSGIHQLQRIIGMRILRREHSDIFPIKN